MPLAIALWGVAALLWVATGLMRLLAGTEKPTSYYLHNHAFWGKMALFVAILVLEIRPIVTFGRWRSQVRRGEMPVLAPARALAHQLHPGGARDADGVGRDGDGARSGLSGRLDGAQSSGAVRMRGSNRYAGSPIRNVRKK